MRREERERKVLRVVAVDVAQRPGEIRAVGRALEAPCPGAGGKRDGRPGRFRQRRAATERVPPDFMCAVLVAGVPPAPVIFQEGSVLEEC